MAVNSANVFSNMSLIKILNSSPNVDLLFVELRVGGKLVCGGGKILN